MKNLNLSKKKEEEKEFLEGNKTLFLIKRSSNINIISNR